MRCDAKFVVFVFVVFVKINKFMNAQNKPKYTSVSGRRGRSSSLMLN